jgi:cell pole-organizing protein PopZ
MEEPAMDEAPIASIFDAPLEEEEPIYNPDPEPDMPLQLTDSMMVEEMEQHHYHQEPDPAPNFHHQEYDYNEGLVSQAVAAASGASISQLAQAVARERAVSLGNHGLTLEELVREICTPILKHWLDSNLPYIVERIVKQEVERIATRAERP